MPTNTHVDCQRANLRAVVCSESVMQELPMYLHREEDEDGYENLLVIREDLLPADVIGLMNRLLAGL